MNKHSISLFLILSVLWLLNSGMYSWLLLTLGLISVLFVVWISLRMDIIDDESQPIHLSRRLPAYYLWLAKKIVQSNIEVVMHIIRGNRSISPCVVSLPIDQKTEMSNVIYANSLTLTPGTIAMDQDGEALLVHALNRKSIEELKQGEMARQVKRLEI